VPQITRLVRRFLASLLFPSSRTYWEARYAAAGTSGKGSYGQLAEFKAEVLNRFVAEHEVKRVIEFGCGDGAQLSLATYPTYVGLDVSASAIELCKARFAGDRSKSFFLYDPQRFVDPLGVFKADLALSLDVVYHLVEDSVFERYMQHLFSAAERFVIIYSSNMTRPVIARHVRHRQFSDWVELNRPEWRLREHVPNRFPITERDGSFADFYIYERG
jgi:cyclopropane fatty-acyl-phospholipid synthase-like methyltransferase